MSFSSVGFLITFVTPSSEPRIGSRFLLCIVNIQSYWKSIAWDADDEIHSLEISFLLATRSKSLRKDVHGRMSIELRCSKCGCVHLSVVYHR